MAASDQNDKLARFSNYGATSVDLAAPGVGIVSTEPGASYASRNGTSMAAPHVTGTAALVWSKIPYATAAEVRQAILQSVDVKADLSGRAGHRRAAQRLPRLDHRHGTAARDLGQCAQHHRAGRRGTDDRHHVQ